jgi:hypothetical protein
LIHWSGSDFAIHRTADILGEAESTLARMPQGVRKNVRRSNGLWHRLRRREHSGKSGIPDLQVLIDQMIPFDRDAL